MKGNCLVIVSKNEGENPLRIADLALSTGAVDKVILSECYDEESVSQSPELDIRRKFFVGKGAAIIDGGTEAINQDFDNIAFIDGDLKLVEKNWFPIMFDSLEQADLVKVSFMRNAKDAQITRHLTRPLISIFFPEVWQLDQPLGGELSVKREVLEKLFVNGVEPPVTWGIDTFITAKTCANGFTVGEVFLGEKVHGKKDLIQLERMFNECLMEMERMIRSYNGRKLCRGELFRRIPSPFVRKEHKEDYMDPVKVFEESVSEFSSYNPLEMPNESLFTDAMSAEDFDSFLEKTNQINADSWIESIHWIAKNFRHEDLKDYYLRWKIRALSFCFHEANSSKEAEENTVLQAKKAREYGLSIAQPVKETLEA